MNNQKFIKNKPTINSNETKPKKKNNNNKRNHLSLSDSRPTSPLVQQQPIKKQMFSPRNRF